MAQVGNEELSLHHRRIRERGVNPWVYWPVRMVLKPFLLLFLRMRRTGREHVPTEGPVILAANHRSFLDPFVIGCCVKQPIYFVAKRELFDRRIAGWILNCLGAFPIKRGESDEESMGTALELLRARRDRDDLPGGHPSPLRPAARPQARRRPAGPAERRADRADRGEGHRARPPRLHVPPHARGPPLRPAR